MKNKVKLIIFGCSVLASMIVGVVFYYVYIQDRANTFWIAFLNIGQGDSALIHFSDGDKMLVDCGPDRTVLSELGGQLPFWDRTIDTLLVTHPDRDHYGGCIDVLTHYNIKKIVTNGRSKPYDPEWVEFDRLVKAEKAEVVALTSPMVWNVNGDTLEFLSPDPSFELDVRADDSNNYSIVFQLIHKVVPQVVRSRPHFALRASRDKSVETFLFTGDMEIPLEDALIQKYCVEHILCPTLQADILKVGHHGSPGSTSEKFVSVVAPKQAIISVGKNKYGHPSQRVIKHLERIGVEVLRTDELGAIVIQ